MHTARISGDVRPLATSGRRPLGGGERAAPKKGNGKDRCDFLNSAHAGTSWFKKVSLVKKNVIFLEMQIKTKKNFLHTLNLLLC
jgi:hypothetical protein